MERIDLFCCMEHEEDIKKKKYQNLKYKDKDIQKFVNYVFCRSGLMHNTKHAIEIFHPNTLKYNSVNNVENTEIEITLISDYNVQNFNNLKYRSLILAHDALKDSLSYSNNVYLLLEIIIYNEIIKPNKSDLIYFSFQLIKSEQNTHSQLKTPQIYQNCLYLNIEEIQKLLEGKNINLSKFDKNLAKVLPNLSVASKKILSTG